MEKRDAAYWKEAVFTRLDQCLGDLDNGRIDASAVQEAVREYCLCLAALPRAEAERHRPDLEEMMRRLNGLSATLTAERDAVRHQLDGLGRLHKANIAYQTSDSIGPRRPKKEGH